VALSDAPETSGYFSVFDAREYDPAVDLSIGELRFRFQPTVHYVPCWAIRVSNGSDGDLLYTADTGPAANLGSFSKGASVMVAEGSDRTTSEEPFASRGHLTPKEAGTLAREAEVNVLILSHLWVEDDPILAMQEAEMAFGGRVILAEPGFRLSWNHDEV
jgi:ribonuclease BN (tRNA processing enzyme)